MSYQITDVDEIYIEITDGLHIWEVPKFRIFMTVDEPYFTIIWNDRERGQNGNQRMITAYYLDIDFGYGEPLPSSASEVAVVVNQFIRSAFGGVVPAPNLSDVLIVGNTTTGSDIVISTGDELIITDATASEIAGFSASSELVSLPVATYPSLTELAYVKGVTSAIQTQVNAKLTDSDAAVGARINASAAATPNDTDIVATADTSILKKITWTNVKAFLKTYFDTLYAAVGWNPEGWTVVIKSANQDVTNAGLTNDTELIFSTVAGGHYAISMKLFVSADNTTADYTWRFQVDAGTIRGKGTSQSLTTAAAIQNVIVTAAGAAQTTAIPVGAPTADLDDLVYVNINYAFTASNTTTIRFRFGNATPTLGATSRTWKGTILNYKRLD